MPHQFINPNFHPLLVHYPIALLMVGAMIELFSFLGWRESTFRIAGRWMILLGALSNVPTALIGIYALNDAAHVGMAEADADAPWRQVELTSPLVNDPVAWQMIVRHAWLVSIASAIVLLVVIIWIGSSDHWRNTLHWPLLLLLLGGIGLTGVGAYFSGEGVYTRAIGVRKLDAPASQPTTSIASVGGTEARSLKQKIEFYVQPEQGHIIAAGTAVAVALLAIGLSIRAITSAAPEVNVDGIGSALGGGERLEDPSVSPTFAAFEDVRPPVPAARFWLLAFLIALLTAVGGWYLLASDGDASMLAFKDLWQWIRDPMQNSGMWLTRRLGHVICGSAIIVLPLLLAAFARWAPRSKALLSICTLLLLCAIAGQVWLGVLLVFDGNSGPVTGYSAVATK